MNSIVQQLQNQLSDEQTRQSLIDSATRREEQLRELGRLDLDCQLLQSGGQPLKAQSLYRHIVALEQKLSLS